MIVEFIGTPGAGKTTLVPVVSTYFKENGYQAYSVLDAARPFAKRTFAGKVVRKIFPESILKIILWQIFYISSYFNRRKFHQKNNALMEAFYHHQEKRPITPSDREHVIHWFVHLTGYYEFFKKFIQQNDVLIFDEGFVHRVVQLFASENEAPDFDLVASYLDLIPKPDLIIFTNTPTNICEERVFSRGVWERFREKDPADTSKFIHHSSEVVNFSAKYMREKGWNLIEVQNGHQEISIVAETLKNQLTQMNLS
jgi:thymidylate kinase